MYQSTVQYIVYENRERAGGPGLVLTFGTLSGSVAMDTVDLTECCTCTFELNTDDF